MKRGRLNPFDDINQFWEYEKEREKEEAKLKLLAGEMRMANSSDALGKYHCSMKNRSPKGNMWSAIPVALLCMIVNWNERKQGSGPKGDKVL